MQPGVQDLYTLPAVSIELLDNELKRMHKEAVEADFMALRNTEHSWEIINLKTVYLVPQPRPELDTTQFSIRQKPYRFNLPAQCMSKYYSEPATTAVTKLLRIREFPIYQPDCLKFLHFTLRLVSCTGIPQLASSTTRKSSPLYTYWGSVQDVRPIGGLKV